MMKLVISLSLIAIIGSNVFALPARNPQDDAEVISVPRRSQQPDADTDFHDFKGVVDTGSGYPFLQPNPPVFAYNLGFFDSFDDIFRRLHARVFPLLKSVGEGVSTEDSDSDSPDSDSPVSGFRLNLRPFLEGTEGNKKSTVKVVNGHKVEVNETSYGNDNTSFKVRLVNIRPLESGEEVAEGVITNNKDEPKDVASNPVTSAPPKRPQFAEPTNDDEEDENDRREPLEKQPEFNEVRDIDGPQRTAQPSTTTTTTPVPVAVTEIETEVTTTTPSTLVSDIELPTERAEDSVADSSNSKDSSTEEEYPQTMAEIVNVSVEQMAPIDDHHLATGKLQQQQQQEIPQDDVQTLTMPHNEETDALHDSHNDEEQATNSPQLMAHSEEKIGEMERDREHLESSDDDEEGEIEENSRVEMNSGFTDEWETLSEDLANANSNDNDDNDLNNHIDIYEQFTPVDLSNDIAVNDIAAANPNFPHNPDAEFIDVEVVPHSDDEAANDDDVSRNSEHFMPKFEKLSLSSSAAAAAAATDDIK